MARTGEQKDPDTAITAMNEIRKAIPDIQISAYGNLNKSRIPDFVDYQSSPSDDEVVALLNSCSLFLQTSILEGYHLPPLEAIACGCAVISSDSVGVWEYLTLGFNGIICPVKNPDSIANRGYETAMKHSYEAMTENFFKAVADFDK